MVAAVRIHKTGGPEVLTYEDIQLKEPGQGEVRIKQNAIGLNYIDTYFRTGLYPAPGGLPMIPGNEGAGVVTAVGPGVTDLKVGDRVAYGAAVGGYAAERNIAAERLVKLDAKIDDKTAAGMMLKGMTAEYLLHRTFKVQKGQTILVHAAAGGVGLILCQWANYLGATVIGTVGSADKAKLAKENGCHHTILYRDEDFVKRVGEITNGGKCHVVYDGVGKATFPGSLDCIKPHGHVRELRQRLGPDRRLQHSSAADQGLAVRDAADAGSLRRQARGHGQHGEEPHGRGGQGRGEDSDQADLCAEGCGQGAYRPRSAQDRGLERPDPVTCRRVAKRACLPEKSGPWTSSPPIG